LSDTRNRRFARESGFTLLEVTVALLTVVIVLLGVLALFDFTNRVSRVQTHVADMQQGLRISQLEVERIVRMAGRGGLPTTNVAPGGAIWVANNVPDNTTIGGAGTPEVSAGTDVLTLRGTFDTPIYQIDNRGGAGSLIYRDNNGQITTNPAQAVRGVLLVNAVSPTQIPQSLEPLRLAIQAGVPEALMLVNWVSPGVYAVVELDPANSGVAGNQATLAFRISGTPLAAAYARLSPNGVFPAAMTSVAFASLVEEHRFYIREVDGFAPRLTRARTLPATEIAYGPAGGPNNANNWALDVTDNVLDLQVALGLDTQNHVPRPRAPGEPNEPPNLTTIAADPVNGYISEAADGEDDDWLFNSADDNRADAVWLNTLPYYMRLTFLVRTERPDPAVYQAPSLATLEDRVYPANHPFNSAVDRRYRRRAVQTVINLRNL